MTREELVAKVLEHPRASPRQLAREMGTTPGVVAGIQFRHRHPHEPKPSTRAVTYTHKLTCGVEPETHEAFHAFAARRGWSMAEALRCLVEWGLEEFDE
jgi:hypothetical protein